jgi:hypothetical protein
MVASSSCSGTHHFSHTLFFRGYESITTACLKSASKDFLSGGVHPTFGLASGISIYVKWLLLDLNVSLQGTVSRKSAGSIFCKVVHIIYM